MSDRSEQMFFDRGEDSFLAEVIGIMRVIEFRLNIFEGVPAPHRVRVHFEAEWGPGNRFNETVDGRSYGECLRKIREEIRIKVGR